MLQIKSKCVRIAKSRQITFLLTACIEYFAKKREEYVGDLKRAESLKMNFERRHILDWVLLPARLFLILEYQLGHGRKTVLKASGLEFTESARLIEEF